MNQIAKRQSTSPPALDSERATKLRLEGEFRDKPDAEALAHAVEMIVAAYPNNKPSNPQVYVDTMIAHLTKYPRVVLEQIVDPRTGVITKTEFPPVVADIEKFAAPILQRMSDQLARSTHAVNQIESREPEISDEERTEMADRLRGLAKKMRADSDEDKETRKASRPRHETCQPGDAIRAHEGLEKPGGK